MNAQLKLLLYIAMICLILYFVQDRFKLFDIKFSSDDSETEESKDEESKEFTIDEGTLVITRADKQKIVVSIEVANTEEERERGLMNRSELGEYNGMLFVFEEDGKNSFWMKNTIIPLDMIFINSDKRVVEVIENAQPCEEGHICPKLTPLVEYMYCLEVNSGFAEANNIEEGDFVEWNI